MSIVTLTDPSPRTFAINKFPSSVEEATNLIIGCCDTVACGAYRFARHIQMCSSSAESEVDLDVMAVDELMVHFYGHGIWGLGGIAAPAMPESHIPKPTESDIHTFAQHALDVISKGNRTSRIDVSYELKSEKDEGWLGFRGENDGFLCHWSLYWGRNVLASGGTIFSVPYFASAKELFDACLVFPSVTMAAQVVERIQTGAEILRRTRAARSVDDPFMTTSIRSK